MREGRRAENRLVTGQRRYKLRLPPRHVIVSFVEAQYENLPMSAEEYDAGLRAAMGVLLSMTTLGKLNRKRGGCIAYHPWRHEGCDWRTGPHYHALFYGRIDATKRPGGVVVLTLRPSQKSLRATWAYVVDHSGVWGKKHTTRWFGAWSYSRFKVPKLEARDFEPGCPVCGWPMVFVGVHEASWTVENIPEGWKSIEK